MAQRMLVLAAAAGLALSIAVDPGMGVTLVRSGEAGETLSALPASESSEQALGNGKIVEIPGFLSGADTLYWPTGTFASGSHFELTCTSEDVTASRFIPCETAWAKGGESTCFLNMELQPKRWGWTNKLPGHSVTMPVYAGAAHCDTSNGPGWVANVHFTYQNDDKDIHVEVVPLPGVTLVHADYHFYIGEDYLPTEGGSYTMAGGQFPAKNMAQPQYTFENINNGNPLYAAIHVSACGSATATPPPPAPTPSPSPPPSPACDCTFYLVSYHCPPCSVPVAGGWSELLNDDEWEARACGPRVVMDESPPQNTIVYKRAVPSGTTVTTIASTQDSHYVGVFGVPCGKELPWCPIPPHSTAKGPNACVAHCSSFVPS